MESSALPGLNAQLLMAPSLRDQELKKRDATIPEKQSAVLILLFEEDEQTKVLMMKRSDHLHHHAGQISFPGGRSEDSDINAWETAIRETEEEVGIDRKSIQYLVNISDLYIPPSNFNVNVCLGYLKNLPKLSPNTDEVSMLLKIPVSHFLNPQNITSFTYKHQQDIPYEAPAYSWEEHTIWGASAMMMSELVELIKKMPTR